jgi:hypothetical protein
MGEDRETGEGQEERDVYEAIPEAEPPDEPVATEDEDDDPESLMGEEVEE